MSKNIKGNQKHMTFEDRYIIEKSLDRQVKFKEIAALLKKDPTTISKEIQKHRTTKSKDPALRKNKCAMLDTCTKTRLCQSKYCLGNNPCAKCKQNSCFRLCDEYVSGTCPKLEKAPYVCNACNSYRVCRYDKKYYRAKYADDIYHEVLSTSREGINQEPERLHEIDSLVAPLLLRGQSIAHIYTTHSDEINCSRRTLYNYIDSGALTVRNIDLPRKVKYKPRRKHKESVNNNQAYRIGRTYEDFQKYMAEHPESNVVEMDTVEGTREGKVLLTMLFRNSSFMLIFLMPANTQECVQNVFNRIDSILGTNRMKELFPIILTDNGSEFKNPNSIECTEDGDIRTRVFYCDPHKSWQKARIEKNHEFIRYIVPKGKPFDSYEQKDITLISNHINSIARASLNERTPFELATLLLDDVLLKALELHAIPYDEVLLKPALLKR